MNSFRHELPTDRDRVVLRELTIEDASAYFEAVHRSRSHLSEFSEETSRKYPDLESVQASIGASDKLRMGIWNGDTFVGTVNLTPQDEIAEIGYWLDERYIGKGFATLAASALTRFAIKKFAAVRAEVPRDHQDSIRVLERSGFNQVSESDDVFVFEYSEKNEDNESQKTIERDQAMRRIVAPVIDFEVVSAIDTFRDKQPITSQEIQKKIDDNNYKYLIEPWLSESRNFETNVEAVLGLICTMELLYKNQGIDYSEIIGDVSTWKVPLNDEQNLMFTQFLNDVRAEKNPASVLEATIAAQSSIVASVALPGYLAEKYRCRNSQQLLHVFNTISVQEIIDIMRDERFLKDIKSMSFAPNGTYFMSVDRDTVPLPPSDRTEADQGYILEYEVEHFGKGNRFHAIDVGTQRAIERNEPKTLENIETEFSVYDIYVEQDDGRVVLDPQFIKYIRTAVRLESKYRGNGESLTPTLGCPAALSRIKLQPSDFTTHQVAQLTSGEDPVMSYSAEDQALTILRNPIDELHKLHIDTLEKFSEIRNHGNGKAPTE